MGSVPSFVLGQRTLRAYVRRNEKKGMLHALEVHNPSPAMHDPTSGGLGILVVTCCVLFALSP